MTLPGLLVALLERRRTVVAFLAVAIIGASVLALTLPRRYDAIATFLPDQTSTRPLAGALGIASQLGIAIGNEPGQSPQFYADLLRSRELTDSVLLAILPASLHQSLGGTPVRLLDVLAKPEADSARRLERARARLAANTWVTVDNVTGVVAVRVRTSEPHLSAFVVQTDLDQVSHFNLVSRQSRARQRRVFTEGQLEAAKKQLDTASNTLRVFYDKNRRWSNSPSLIFEKQELERRLSMAVELVTSLSHEYQTAKIDEVNDAPVITIVDRPVPPARKAWPHPVSLLASAVVLTLLAEVAFVVSALQWRQASEHPDSDAGRLRLALIAAGHRLRTRKDRGLQSLEQPRPAR